MKPLLRTIAVYTDGSLRKTSKGNVCGYGIHFANNALPDTFGPFRNGNVTNNRAELYAIYRAIKLIKQTYRFETVDIYTDSQYCQKSLTEWIQTWKKNGWKNAQKKPVENQDIIQKIDKYLQKYAGKINIYWIHSHTNNKDEHSKGNAKADMLANLGADEYAKLYL